VDRADHPYSNRDPGSKAKKAKMGFMYLYFPFFEFILIMLFQLVYWIEVTSILIVVALTSAEYDPRVVAFFKLLILVTKAHPPRCTFLFTIDETPSKGNKTPSKGRRECFLPFCAQNPLYFAYTHFTVFSLPQWADMFSQSPRSRCL
jgi:hypothetical protein